MLRSNRIPELASWGVIIVFACVAAWFVAVPHRVGDVFTETDFYGAYAQGARLVQQGHLDPARYAVVGPGFELALALVGLVVRDLFLAAELISLVSMVAMLALWRTTLRHLGGAVLSLVAVALLASNAQVLRYGYAVTTDALALALQAAALCVLLTRAGSRAMFLAGVLAGLAFLTRYTHGVLLVAGPVAIMVGWTAAPREHRVREALRFVSGFLVLVAPWVVYSLARGGGAGIQLHHNLAYDVFARAKGIPWDTYQREMQSQFPTPWSVFARSPSAVTSRLLFNIWDHLRLDALKTTGLALAVSAGAGLVLGWREGALRRLAPVLFTCGLAFMALVPAFHSERYSMVLLPAWVALAGAAFAPLVPRRGVLPWLRGWLALVPIALGSMASVRVQQRALSQLPVEVLPAAQAVQPFIKPGEYVLARKPHFAYHAGLKPLAFPFVDTLPELADYARAHGVRWLYFSWPEAEMRPSFRYLLDTTSAVPGLTVRAVTTHNPAVVYEIGPGFGAEPAWAGNDTLRAVHEARATAAIDDRDVNSRVLLTLYARQNQRWSEAQPYIEQAVQLRPDDLFVLGLLAENLTQLGRYSASEMTWQKVAARTPNDSRVALARGGNALLDGRPQDAAQLWRPVVFACEDPVTLRRMLELFTQAEDPAAIAEVRARMTALGVRP
ncbi:MAG: glycosyltransferase family 39 protein [Candidatus Eisenbacteria bacterium]